MNKAEHMCLQSVVQDLIDHKELRMPAWHWIQQEKKALLERQGLATDAATFDGIVSLHSVDEEFKIAFVASHSDLTTDDIIRIVKHDATALNDLVAYATQVPMKVKLPPQSWSSQSCRRSSRIGTGSAAAGSRTSRSSVASRMVARWCFGIGTGATT